VVHKIFAGNTSELGYLIDEDGFGIDGGKGILSGGDALIMKKRTIYLLTKDGERRIANSFFKTYDPKGKKVVSGANTYGVKRRDVKKRFPKRKRSKKKQSKKKRSKKKRSKKKRSKKKRSKKKRAP
jgi:hypothetical protein